MGLFANPLSHAGYPPGVTGTPSTQPSEVRAATLAEAEAGTLDSAYISPATLSASSTANFASPPPIGSVVPNTIVGTTVRSTGTLTGGTGVVATTGNLAASAVGSGLLLNPTVVTGAASGTVTANGRVVAVTFTGVSIAGGANQIFTTANSSISGSTTRIFPTLVGATNGAALTVESVANTAGQSVITVQNGTGATTTTANLTIYYFVLN
jgi:hypothetical protein